MFSRRALGANEKSVHVEENLGRCRRTVIMRHGTIKTATSASVVRGSCTTVDEGGPVPAVSRSPVCGSIIVRG